MKGKRGPGGGLTGERQLNSFEGEWEQLGSFQRDFCHLVGRVQAWFMLGALQASYANTAHPSNVTGRDPTHTHTRAQRPLYDTNMMEFSFSKRPIRHGLKTKTTICRLSVTSRDQQQQQTRCVYGGRSNRQVTTPNSFWFGWG